ncbi:MAG: hypothetical protein J4F31_03515 [Flavobacteriales bacterium]|nr:hypothetical protein [Flavobacteriales bacterium]
MKNTKITLMALTLLTGFGSTAQPYREKMSISMEKVEAKKIAFITERLDLSPEQAQKFWPVYNEFQDKLNEARKDQLEIIRPSRDEPNRTSQMSDEELAKMMEMRFDLEQKELNLKVEYHKRFLKVLETRQVARLYTAEHEFKRFLFEEMRSERGERGERGEGRKEREKSSGLFE